VPQHLPRFYRHQQRADDIRRLAEILLENDVDAPDARTVTRAQHHDQARLRGLPAVGRGVQGAIRGTSPHHALIEKERRGRL
jgi:hypothetical protein